MDLMEKKLTSKTVFQGRIIQVLEDQVTLPNGRTATREVVRHPGGVAVVALDGQDRVALVRQYRYAFEQELVELPAGKLDPAEQPCHAAQRELREETGLCAGQWDELGTILASPGFCDECLHLFLATQLHEGPSSPDEDEFLAVEWMSFSQLVEMVMDGRIADAKTVAGALKAKVWLGR